MRGPPLSRRAPPDIIIRPGRDEDAPAIRALIDASRAEFPGPAGPADRLGDLARPATHYAERRGALFIAAQGEDIIGLAASAPTATDGTIELTDLQVRRDLRGGGLALRLLNAVETAARGMQRLQLWCDTRADAAQRFFEKHGYLREGPIRVREDGSKALEFAYAKPLAGIQVISLDAAAAASADRRLGDILTLAANSDAQLPLFSGAEARRYWRGVSADVAGGRRVLLAGWVEGVLAGAVQLDINMPPYQDHRGEVQHLLILPAYRGGGLALALMAALETAARARGRRLLTLNAMAGGPAEALARATHWQEGGRIPGFTVTARGVPCDMLFFWKALG